MAGKSSARILWKPKASGAGRGWAQGWLPEGLKGMKASHPRHAHSLGFQRSPPVSTRGGQGPEGWQGRGGFGLRVGWVGGRAPGTHRRDAGWRVRWGGGAGRAQCSARLAACDCGWVSVASPLL